MSAKASASTNVYVQNGIVFTIREVFNELEEEDVQENEAASYEDDLTKPITITNEEAQTDPDNATTESLRLDNDSEDFELHSEIKIEEPSGTQECQESQGSHRGSSEYYPMDEDEEVSLIEFVDSNASKEGNERESSRGSSEYFPVDDDEEVSYVASVDSDSTNEKHRRSFRGLKGPFNCMLCSKLFSTSGYLTKHFIRIHSGEKPFDCKYCGMKFSDSGNLCRHKRRAHKDEESRQLVTKSSSAAGVSGKHTQRTETEDPKDRPYSCGVCDEKFANVRNLKDHSKTHTNVKSFPCKLCKKSFLTSDSLVRHIVRLHTDDKPFACKFCDKKYSDAGNLSRHKKVHEIEDLVCQICNKSFSTARVFGDHLRTHSKKRTPHATAHTSQTPQSGPSGPTCHLCGESFSRLDSLKRHLKNHSNPLSCHICKESFHQSSDLKDHLETHAKEKPFVCRFCEKKFSYSTSLVRHAKVHTG